MCRWSKMFRSKSSVEQKNHIGDQTGLITFEVEFMNLEEIKSKIEFNHQLMS